ncbi:MAG TPA: lysozyme inhibitor LprI family protein [Allosphingosinicella sp.]|nr:lysozyme inhibitor LprI family protein [Allosphingosinicella sp.]
MTLLALVLAAASPSHDPRCHSDQTNDLINCAGAELATADAALNAVWRKARTKAAAQDRDMEAATRAGNGGVTFLQSLLAAQRAWLAYRDAQCRFVTYRNFGGRELRIYQAGCRANLTQQRVKALKEFIERQ